MRERASESRFSPNRQIQGNHTGDRAAEGSGGFAGQRFAQDLNAAGSGAAVHDVDLRKRYVGEFLVVPEHRGGRNEEADVEAVIAALAIEERDELVESRRPAGAACSGEGKAARGAIEPVGVADQD